MEINDKLISTGDICDVYLRTDLKKEIKNIVRIYKKTDPGYFCTEKEILLRYRTVNFPALVDAYSSEEGDILITEYVQGCTILEKVRAQRVFSREEAAETIKLIIKAILRFYSVSENRYVFTDLSPGNIVMREDGEISIVDLNSVMVKGNVFRTATPGFSVEESFNNAFTDNKADIYSIGKLYCFMLTGGSELPKPGVLCKKDENILSKCIVHKAYENLEELADELGTEEKKRNILVLFKRRICVTGKEEFALELVFLLRNMGYRASIENKGKDTPLLKYFIKYDEENNLLDTSDPDVLIVYADMPDGSACGEFYAVFHAIKAHTYAIDALYDDDITQEGNIFFVFFNYDKKFMIPKENLDRIMPKNRYICIPVTKKRSSFYEMGFYEYFKNMKIDKNYRKITDIILGEQKR
jgi:serine/threonine protein kinase